jgi:hypothetical protein
MFKPEDLEKMTQAEIALEIEKRENLIKQMVGRLYPSILADEIAELRSIYVKRA